MLNSSKFETLHVSIEAPNTGKHIVMLAYPSSSEQPKEWLVVPGTSEDLSDAFDDVKRRALGKILGMIRLQTQKANVSIVGVNVRLPGAFDARNYGFTRSWIRASPSRSTWLSDKTIPELVLPLDCGLIDELPSTRYSAEAVLGTRTTGEPGFSHFYVDTISFDEHPTVWHVLPSLELKQSFGGGRSSHALRLLAHALKELRDVHQSASLNVERVVINLGPYDLLSQYGISEELAEKMGIWCKKRLYKIALSKIDKFFDAVPDAGSDKQPAEPEVSPPTHPVKVTVEIENYASTTASLEKYDGKLIWLVDRPDLDAIRIAPTHAALMLRLLKNLFAAIVKYSNEDILVVVPTKNYGSDKVLKRFFGLTPSRYGAGYSSVSLSAAMSLDMAGDWVCAVLGDHRWLGQKVCPYDEAVTWTRETSSECTVANIFPMSHWQSLVSVGDAVMHVVKKGE